jgi:hypothetical protein
MTQEALKLALDFVETVHVGEWVGSIERQLEVITAIKEALAQPEQEPVALETLLKWDDDIDPIGEVVGFIEGSPYIMVKVHKGKQVSLDDDLYATPPQRTWQGLTDEEIAQGCKESWVTEQAWQSAVWWAEARLKEKNA